MQYRDQTLQGLYTYDYSNPSSSSNNSYLKTVGKRVVLPAAVVKGDHVHPNPWGYDIFDIDYPTGLRETSRLSTKELIRETGYIGSSHNVDVVTSAASYDACYNQALAKLYDNIRGGMDLSIDAFQTKQNLRLLNDSAKLLSWAQSVPLIKRASSALLTFQYGFRPLVRDVYDVANESLRYVLNRIETYQGRAVVRSGSKLAVDNDSAFSQFGPSDGLHSHEAKVGVTFRVACEVKDFDLARWTSLNPVSIAWEILPYSFVVDWFYDIGGMLRSFESAVLYGQSFRYGSISKIFVDSNSYDCRPTSISSDFEQYGVINGKSRRVRFERSILPAMPTPHLPSIKTHLGSERLLNAAALLGNLLKVR